MRYCGIFDPIQLGRITLRQYMLMVKAIQLRHMDKERDIHAQAWLNVQAKAIKQQGKKTVPYFRSFSDFFKPAEDKPETAESRRLEQERKQLKNLILQANIR